MPSTPTSTGGLFPLKDYFALHSYLSSLLCASFVFLPHSSPWLLGTSSVQRSSADRPEHPFLTPLTSRPLVSMLWDIFGVILCMAWWSHRMSSWWHGDEIKSDVVGENEIAERQSRVSRNLQRYGQAMGSCLVGAAGFTLFTILLGAPLDSYRMHTFLLSLHVAVLLIWPVIYTLGLPSMYDTGLHARYRMTRLFCDFRPESNLERALVYPVVGTLVGAWVGAAPLALDWDRPWQSYPLTPTFGSILGFIAGGYISWLHSALEDTLLDVQTQPKPSVQSKPKSKKKKSTKHQA